MFEALALVLKDGELVVKDGKVTDYRRGETLRLDPGPASDGAAISVYFTTATGWPSTGSL